MEKGVEKEGRKRFKKKLGIEDRKERTKVSLVVSSSTIAWPPVLYFRFIFQRVPIVSISQDFPGVPRSD